MADNHFVALEDLFVSRGVRAYYKGESVADEAVHANGWEDKVARPSAKSAQAVTPEG